MHLILWQDIWFDNIKNLQLYNLLYNVGNSLTSLITSHITWWCAVACNPPIWDKTAEMHWNGNKHIQNFRSPEPLAHGELLWSLDGRRTSSSVVNNCFIGHLLKQLAGFLPNLADLILIRPSLIIVYMFQVRCISRSHRLKIDFHDENFKNLLVWNHKALSLDI